MPESYRIGEFLKTHGGGGRNPDGDHVAHVQSLELTNTKNNQPQFKVVSKLLDLGGRQHTWYYPLWDDMLWKLFNDVIAAGCSPDFDPGPPGPQWVDAFRPGFVNKVFNITVKTDGDFQNTKITGPAQGAAQLPPATDPTQQPQPAPSGCPGGGNAPTPVQPQGNPWGATLPMQTGQPAPTQWGGGNGATPQQMTDATSLFKTG